MAEWLDNRARLAARYAERTKATERNADAVRTPEETPVVYRMGISPVGICIIEPPGGKPQYGTFGTVAYFFTRYLMEPENRRRKVDVAFDAGVFYHGEDDALRGIAAMHNLHVDALRSSNEVSGQSSSPHPS